MNETAILKQCMKEASRCGAVVFRNNTGVLKDQNGRPVKFGLCTGGSDLIGWYQGIFLAIEIKTPTGKPTPVQLNFIEQVNKAGGIGFIARSPEDVIKHLGVLRYI